MSDGRLRELERRWRETGSKEDRKIYERARMRAGLGRLPREVIRHYVGEEWHGHVGDGGTFDLDATDIDSIGEIASKCGNQLWPRELHPFQQRWGSTFRKEIHYTEDPDEVTCKLCLRSMRKPEKRERYRTHYAPGSRHGRASGEEARPICGRNDSDKFTETVSWNMRTVNCPSCKRIMQMGRRRSRKPKFAVPGPLDGLPGGNFPVGV